MSVIPLPARIDLHAGEFTVRSSTRIVAPDDPGAGQVAQYLADLLSRTVAMKLEIAPPSGAVPQADTVTLVLNSTGAPANGNPEGYTLDIGPRGIVIEASDRRGLFYGAVTLWQWLTARPQSGNTLRAPAVHIEDQPQTSWRGFMLDVARHRMPVEFIEQMIDWMALHKLNTFHWHLTDDQGWRLQILKYPRLTEVGSRGQSPRATTRRRKYAGSYATRPIASSRSCPRSRCPAMRRPPSPPIRARHGRSCSRSVPRLGRARLSVQCR